MFTFNDINSLEELKTLLSKNSSEYVILNDDCYKSICVIKNPNNMPVAIMELLDTIPTIQWFEVFPKYQRQGYGQKIIQEFIDYQSQTSDSFSISITALNEQAAIFWSKCGFVFYPAAPNMIYQYPQYS